MPLARYAPADVPLYGLQGRGLGGTTALPRSVREMATDYVEQLRSVQPSGPYHVLGWSFGGVAAHEMAVQLQAAGEEVALVILDQFPWVREPDADPAESQDDRLDHLMDVVRQEAGTTLGAVTDEEVRMIARIVQNNRTIQVAHEHGRFDGDALLIVAGEERPGDAPTGERWKPYVTGEITEVSAPCTHYEMAKPENLGWAWSAISDWLGPED
jgi:thioesterase domain-containing protein